MQLKQERRGRVTVVSLEEVREEVAYMSKGKEG